MTRSRFTAFAAALITSACAGSENPSAGRSEAITAAEAQVAARMNAYPAVLESGDVNAVMDHWAADVRVFEPEIRLEGPELRAMVEEFLRTNTVSDVELTDAQFVAHDEGNVTYLFATYAETITPKSGGAPSTVKNNFVARWRRDAGGVWKVDRLIAAPAPSMATPATVVPIEPVRPEAPVDARPIVEQRLQAYASALRADDWTRGSPFWADDAVFQEPAIEINDKAALDAFALKSLAGVEIQNLQVTPEETTVHDDGAVVYQWGHYTETVVPKTGKPEPQTIRNAMFIRWKRGADGEYRMDRFVATPLPKQPK